MKQSWIYIQQTIESLRRDRKGLYLKKVDEKADNTAFEKAEEIGANHPQR